MGCYPTHRRPAATGARTADEREFKCAGQFQGASYPRKRPKKSKADADERCVLVTTKTKTLLNFPWGEHPILPAMDFGL
jgi:hypothetical protein